MITQEEKTIRKTLSILYLIYAAMLMSLIIIGYFILYYL